MYALVSIAPKYAARGVSTNFPGASHVRSANAIEWTRKCIASNAPAYFPNASAICSSLLASSGTNHGFVTPKASTDRFVRAWHGMTRALIQNMVVGVTKGNEKKLEIQGVGWNAAAQGNKVVLNIGFNKPVTVPMPVGVQVGTPSPTSIVLSGTDKQKVGHIAAAIRQRRPPEPYKGKGIRFEGEIVKRKAGTSFGAAAS